MKTILVTGGNGFIGRHVVNEAMGRGYRVAILDRHRYPVKTPVEIYFGDIKDRSLVNDAVSHVDGVIHLAGVLGTQETIENPTPAAETNILGGLNVIESCAQYDIPLVNIAVGNYWMTNTYSITKNTVERFVEMTERFRMKPMASVRAFNAYGPGQVPAHPFGPSRVRKIMPSFICRALSGLPIEIYGNGQQIMDMIYVTDVTHILVSALERLDSSGPFPTIQAGTGVPTTVNDVAEAVKREVETVTDVKVRIDHLPMRPGEDEDSVVLADTDTLRVIDMGPDDLVKLDHGVEHTVAYFRRYLDASDGRDTGPVVH